MFGDALFHYLFGPIKWALSWTVPSHVHVEACNKAVKVTGKKRETLEPGQHWYFERVSTVYEENVMRKVEEPADVVATTQDDFSVRVGLAVEYSITNVDQWLIQNEDAEKGFLIAIQAVVLAFVRTHDFAEIQRVTDEKLAKLVHKDLGRKFGVKVTAVGLTTFVQTEAKDLNHSGAAIGAAEITSSDDED